MVRSPRLPLLALVALLVLPAALEAQEEVDRRPGIAVIPFINGGAFGEGSEDLELLEVGLQQLLLSELAQYDTLRIVERSVLSEAIEEQNLGASGRVDAATAAQVGRIVGARYMITGSFIQLSGDFHLNARVVDVETTEYLVTERLRDDRENLYPLVVRMAEAIVEDIDLPLLPAPAREARRERSIPAEAITLYSRAQVLQDAGGVEQAAEVYRRIIEEFPEMTEARQALQQISGL